MALEHSSISVTYKDFDLEPTTIAVNGAPVLNDGTNYVAVKTAADAVVAALDALALGTKVKETFIATQSAFEETRPADKAAQRETKLFIGGENLSTFQPRHLTLGTFDPDELADIPENQNIPAYLDLSAGNGAALKTALDNYWTDAPAYTVSIITKSATHVGRNT